MKRLLRKNILTLLLSFAGLLFPASLHAQFVGFTSPQTVQQTLATNLACTGTAQNFVVANLGQTQHYLSIANVIGVQKFQAEIDALDNQGNVLRISDIAELAGIVTTRQGTLSGSGYFPVIRASVTCSPGTGTFTASYSGTSSAPNGAAGTYLTAQIDKVNFFQLPANVNQQDNFQTPFGNSAGTIYFQYNTSSVAGGSLSVACNANGPAAATFNFSVTLANTVGLQTFTVGPGPCPFAQVQYISPGGGTTVSAEYIFSVPGSGLGGVIGPDPCASSGIGKQSVVIAAGAATTTQIVPLGTGLSIYVCGYEVSQAATAGTLQWVFGSGANCGTGTGNLTGAIPDTASQPISYGGGAMTLFKAPISNALCLATTGAGGTAAGVLTFVQQ